MEFRELKKNPEFYLKLSLEEAISLWKIVNAAHTKGNNNATPFVDALYEFSSNSNQYEEYLR